ncbi:protein of unknown function (plasmid) [Streptantibioticus cattleyicolor NRRL 8057 = DSM 46488]|nr:protein of unknown function [Streptantibioticus cattleyicolor NRRL 8057 = DSM 46488]
MAEAGPPAVPAVFSGRAGAGGRPAPARVRPPAATAQAVQRRSVPSGVPEVEVTAVPPREPAAAPPDATRQTGTAGAEGSGGPVAGLDIDELARRLIEPVGRLLRTELRRGRERAGRPYDGRR